MCGNDILLLFLPSKLFPFKITDLLHLFAFLYKTVMSLFIDLLKVGNVLLALGSSMIVDFVRSLRSEEVWVSAVMIIS